MEFYKFDASLIKWIKSFLSDRKQRVVINGVSSSWHHVKSGIPQGSILGPVLFVIFINTMVDTVQESTVYLYADDTKIYREVLNNEDSKSLKCKEAHTGDFSVSFGNCPMCHSAGVSGATTDCCMVEGNIYKTFAIKSQGNVD